jgi:dolichyl-phosphate-mannose--protein O-mannosyl transferase
LNLDVRTLGGNPTACWMTSAAIILTIIVLIFDILTNTGRQEEVVNIVKEVFFFFRM